MKRPSIQCVGEHRRAGARPGPASPSTTLHHSGGRHGRITWS